MTMDVGLEFIGGPRDGEVWMVPNDGVLADHAYAPIHRDVFLVGGNTAVYHLALNPATNLPSINDAGHYRYEFGHYQ